MKKVLITGAGGFVGQHLITALLPDHFIIGLNSSQALNSSEKVEYYRIDVGDGDQVKGLIEKYQPEVVIHLAAKTTVWNTSFTDIFKTNFFGTLSILESIAEVQSAHDYHPKVIYISSAEVYGNAAHPESIDENELLSPINFYASSKVAADRLVYQYSQSKNLNTVILRPFNHTGPGQRLGFFVPDMASQIVKIEQGGENKILVGNLETTRDYLDVRDVVRAYLAVVKKDVASGEVFNISSGQGITMRDLLKILLHLTPQEIALENDVKRLRASDVKVSVGSSKKFRDCFYWQPEIALTQTLEDVLNYWRSK